MMLLEDRVQELYIFYSFFELIKKTFVFVPEAMMEVVKTEALI